MSISKSYKVTAEYAAEWYAIEQLYCTNTRRTIRTRFQKVDFFACDIIGKRSNGSHVYLQVTTGGYQAVYARKKKIERIPWHISDTVKLLQLVEDGKVGNRKNYKFIVNEYRDGKWTNANDFSIPREWFKPKANKGE